MIANFGYGALGITFLVSLYGVGAAVAGVRRNQPRWVESARIAMLLTWPLVTLSALSIIYLLVTEQYDVEYVALVTSSSMPLYLKVTALWGGQEGSLVFWSWLMAAFASAVMLRKWERDREFLPWVIVVSLVTLAFFLALILLFENPFERLWQSPGSTQPFAAMFAPAGAIPF
jgi:cytochrome c-type biogenesis protein CcmF